MQKHTKIYFEYFGFDVGDFVACEICGKKATEIHHIEARGMGGDPSGSKDSIENLQAICRSCHLEFGDHTDMKDKLKDIHFNYMKYNG